jgi:hypothetical protein
MLVGADGTLQPYPASFLTHATDTSPNSSASLVLQGLKRRFQDGRERLGGGGGEGCVKYPILIWVLDMM